MFLYAHILWRRQLNSAECKKTVPRLNAYEIHVAIPTAESKTTFLHLLQSLLLTCNGYIRKNNKNQLLYLLKNKACLEIDHMQWYTHSNKNTQNRAWDFNSSIFATSWHHRRIFLLLWFLIWSCLTIFTIQVKQMQLNTRKQNKKHILFHKIESIFPL